MWISHSMQVRMSEWWKQERHVTRAGNRRVCKWEKSEQDHVKVNCDAVYDPASGNGAGCVMRDADDDTVRAHRGRVEFLMNSLHGELIACIQVVQAMMAA